MISKKSILYFLIFSVAFAFVGCKKKPRRPNPLDTVIGDTSGTSGRSENIEDLTGPGTLAAGETTLFDRGIMDGERGERGNTPEYEDQQYSYGEQHDDEYDHHRHYDDGHDY